MMMVLLMNNTSDGEDGDAVQAGMLIAKIYLETAMTMNIIRVFAAPGRSGKYSLWLGNVSRRILKAQWWMVTIALAIHV
jgi:hypothetical protein